MTRAMTTCLDCGVSHPQLGHVTLAGAVYVTCTGRLNEPCAHAENPKPDDFGRLCDECVARLHRRDAAPDGSHRPLVVRNVRRTFRTRSDRYRALSQILGVSDPDLIEARSVGVAAVALSMCSGCGVDLQGELRRRGSGVTTGWPELDAVLGSIPTHELEAALDILEEEASA